jgi:hypothetical protein
MRNFLVIPVLLLCSFLVATGTAVCSDGADGPVAPQEQPDFNEFNLKDYVGIDIDVELHASMVVSSVWVNNPGYSSGNAMFVENVVGVGAEFWYGEHLKAEFRVVGSDVHRRPRDWTNPQRTDWGTRTDIAYVQLSAESLGNLTVGYQEICYGDGLLISDGFADKRAVWSNRIRSFPAVRWQKEILRGFTLDLFTAIVHDNYLNYEAWLGDRVRTEGGGNVSGANLKILDEETFGEIDVGLFFKEDKIEDDDPLNRDPNSDTWALSLRDSVTWEDFTFTGEIVKQWGRTKVVGSTLTNDRHPRSALGGHATVQYDIPEVSFEPYVRARWAQFQGDSPSSSTVEAFDPFFSGNQTWGTWYMGDMSSYFYPNSNKRVIMVEGGLVPVEKTRIRLIYYDISFDQKMRNLSGSPQWSNEINLIFDYKLCDKSNSFVGLLLGATTPGGAAEAYFGDDRTQKEVAVWAGFSF